MVRDEDRGRSATQHREAPDVRLAAHPHRESLAYMSDQMGHARIQVTVGVYDHLVPGSNRAAVDR